MYDSNGVSPLDTNISSLSMGVVDICVPIFSVSLFVYNFGCLIFIGRGFAIRTLSDGVFSQGFDYTLNV